MGIRIIESRYIFLECLQDYCTLINWTVVCQHSHVTVIPRTNIDCPETLILRNNINTRWPFPRSKLKRHCFEWTLCHQQCQNRRQWRPLFKLTHQDSAGYWTWSWLAPVNEKIIKTEFRALIDFSRVPRQLSETLGKTKGAKPFSSDETCGK